MRVLSFVWGRNARHMATAVARWPEYFLVVDGMPRKEVAPADLLALFNLGALPREVANSLHSKWRRYSWEPHRVREKIDDWRVQQKDPNLLRLRVHGARVQRVVNSAGANSLLITWVGDHNAPVGAWTNKKIDLLITERKGED
jgi:hypothetical protein